MVSKFEIVTAVIVVLSLNMEKHVVQDMVIKSKDGGVKNIPHLGNVKPRRVSTLRTLEKNEVTFRLVAKSYIWLAGEMVARLSKRGSSIQRILPADYEEQVV